MRRLWVLVVLALVAVAAAIPALASSPDRARPAPRLSLNPGSPLVVTGRGFRAGEAVRVRVSWGAIAPSRKVRATSAGRFRVTFAAVRLDRCGPGLWITATGAAGSRATLRRLPGQCAPSRAA